MLSAWSAQLVGLIVELREHRERALILHAHRQVHVLRIAAQRGNLRLIGLFRVPVQRSGLQDLLERVRQLAVCRAGTDRRRTERRAARRVLDGGGVLAQDAHCAVILLHRLFHGQHAHLPDLERGRLRADAGRRLPRRRLPGRERRYGRPCEQGAGEQCADDFSFHINTLSLLSLAENARPHACSCNIKAVLS